MKEINDLPIELYSSIFKYLTIKDLFNCKLVNKQFKCSTYESINKLIVGNFSEFDFLNEKFWHYNNELMNKDDLISLEYYRKIRSSSIFNLKASLKYLIIRLPNNPKSFKEECVIINEFINLECLELYVNNGFGTLKNIKIEINLKNLKYFMLNSFYNDRTESIYELNTPKLKKIKFDDTKKLHIKSNPDSIKHLITFDYEDHLKMFKNLEIIEFQDWRVFKLNENLLSFFKNLKQLKFNFICNLYGDIDGDCFNEEFIQCLIKIFNSRIELNKDIDIYLYDVKLIDTQQLIDTLQLEEERPSYNIFIYQINNYDLLDSTKIIKICYNGLYRNYHNIRDELPASFFDKYQNISIVSVGCMITKNKDCLNLFINDLNWFLNNLKCLKELELSGGFNQNFFNNLPNSIRKILIVDNEKYSYSKINFDFILKLNRLREFIIHSDIDLFDILLSAFSNLDYLNRFAFTFKGNKINIRTFGSEIFGSEIFGSDYYLLEYRENNRDKTIQLKYFQLVQKCNEIRSKLKEKNNFLSKFRLFK